MFAEYQKLCEQKKFNIGNLWIYKTPNKWILNFPTKEHWRNPSRFEYIEAGLKKLVSTYSNLGITSIAFPLLGCGNGELNWDKVVQPLMTKYLSMLPIDIFIHECSFGVNIPEHKDIEAMQNWLRADPKALPFSEMWLDLSKAISNGITLENWDDASEFSVSLVMGAEEGICVKIPSFNAWGKILHIVDRLIPLKFKIVKPNIIFMPKNAFFDLWQSIRGYGFCLPRIMPAGLDSFSLYVLPILKLLPYMKQIELSNISRTEIKTTQTGLLLFAQATQLNISPIINNTFSVVSK